MQKREEAMQIKKGKAMYFAFSKLFNYFDLPWCVAFHRQADVKLLSANEVKR
jgi:hypothetical protein